MPPLRIGNMKSKANYITDIFFGLFLALTVTTKFRFIYNMIGPSEICGVICIILVLIKVLIYKENILPNKWFFVGWGVFFGSALIGSWVRSTMTITFPVGITHNYLAFIYLFCISYCVILEYKSFHRIYNMFKFLAVFSLIISLIPLILFHAGIFSDFLALQTPQGARYSGLALNPNQLGLICLITGFVSLYLLKNSTGKARIIWLCAFIVQFISAYTTKSNAAQLVCLLAPIFFILFYLTRRYIVAKIPNWQVFISLVLLLITLSSALLITLDIPAKIVAKAKDLSAEEKRDSNFRSRLLLYKSALQAIEKSPIFGLGFGGHIGYRFAFEKKSLTKEAHNSFLDITLTAGILGLLAFLVLISRAFYNLYKNNEIILLSGLISLMTFGLVHNFLRQPLPVVFIFICCLLPSFNPKRYSTKKLN